MNTTINDNEGPKELVDKVINQNSFKDKVSVFMIIMTRYCVRKKMTLEWGESILFQVTSRRSKTWINVENPMTKDDIQSFREGGIFISNIELELKEFLFLLNKKDRELYQDIFLIFEKKRKKENIRNNIIVVVIVVVVIVILFSL